MKKLFLTLITALALTACSTDADTELQTANANKKAERAAATTTTLEPQGNTPTIQVPCFKTMTAYYDNSGTFSFPKWKFVATIPESVPAGDPFKVILEVQETDGEDITVGIGPIIQHTDNVIFNNVSVIAPFVERTPSQLPLWYRWRLKVVGVNYKNTSSVICTQYTAWNDTPLG